MKAEVHHASRLSNVINTMNYIKRENSTLFMGVAAAMQRRTEPSQARRLVRRRTERSYRQRHTADDYRGWSVRRGVNWIEEP